jgi:hypothetical protein
MLAHLLIPILGLLFIINMQQANKLTIERKRLAYLMWKANAFRRRK